MQSQPAQPQETWLAPLPVDAAGMPVAQRPTDHSLAGLFPLLEGDDFASLQADIASNGLHEPIVLLGGQILDGRNRHRACVAAGVEARFTTYDGDDPIGYVLSLNLHRRHLDESQRAMVASKLANLTSGRPHAVDKRANLPGIPVAAPSVSAARAAEMLNVSERSVKAARSVHAQAIPEIITKVERGEFKVSAAAEVAKLPTSVQRVIAMCSKLPTAAEARKMAKEKGVYVPARDGKLHDGRSAAEEKADGDASQRAGSILHPLKEIIETGMTPASYFAALDVPRFGRFLDDDSMLSGPRHGLGSSSSTLSGGRIVQLRHWTEVLSVACTRHRRPSKAQCYAIAWEMFPADMEADQVVKARRGHMSELAAAMRTASNLDEQEDGPTVQMDLPGLQAPTYLTVPDPDGGLTLVKYAKSFRPERRAAIDIRKSVVGRIQNRVRDLEQKERYLAPFTPDDQTTVEQAIARAEAIQNRMRRSSEENLPGAAPPP